MCASLGSHRIATAFAATYRQWSLEQLQRQGQPGAICFHKMFRDFSHQLGDDRDVPADVHSHECPSSVLRWFNKVFMRGSFPWEIVISVVSARTCVSEPPCGSC